MRLIDTDTLKYRRKDYGGYDDVGDDERKRGILYMLENDIAVAPTIDAVPVVRCKECKYWDKTWNDITQGYKYCPMIDCVRSGDFYCADGEGREE